MRSAPIGNGVWTHHGAGRIVSVASDIQWELGLTPRPFKIERSNMKSKTIGIVAVLLASAGLLAGYARLERSHLTTITSGGVCFSLGGGWQPDVRTAGRELYPTRFISQAGVVRVILLPPELGDLRTAAAGLLKTFETDPQTVKGSFTQETFVTDRALSGIHACYRQEAQQDGRKIELERHHYFVRNHSGRFVAINYQAGRHGDPAAIDRMIRNTLRLQ